MKVTVYFDFAEVTDINGEVADQILESLFARTVEWQEEFQALPPHMGYGKNVFVWIDEEVQ